MLHFIVSKSESHKLSFSSKGQPISKWPDVLIRNRLAHTTLGQPSMEGLEQENQVLREEVATMQAKINELAAMQTQVDELTELVRTLRAAQNVPPPFPINTQAEAGTSTIPGWTLSFNTPQQTIPEGRLWAYLLALVKCSALMSQKHKCQLLKMQFLLLRLLPQVLKLL